MVLTTTTHAKRCSKDSTTTIGHSASAGGKGMAQPLIKKMTLMVCRVSMRSLKTQGTSKRDSDIILQSWDKEYGSSMRRTSCNWQIKYCHRKHVHCVDPSISQASDFLVELYDQGIGYSAMNTARSALTSILPPVNGFTFGAQYSHKIPERSF